MKKAVFSMLLAIVIAFYTGMAFAVPVSSEALVGNNFSVTWGEFNPLLDGQNFNWRDYEADGSWVYGSQTIDLPFNFADEDIVSADLSIILGGAGTSGGVTSVAFNGFNLGPVTVGYNSVGNMYALDVYPLLPEIVSSLGAINTLKIQTNSGDGYVPLGFSLDGQVADNGGTAPVPEPATMLLFGTGLVGLVGTMKKKKKKNK